MVRESELVAQLGSNDTVLQAMRELVGGVTATELEHCELSDAALEALISGLSDPNPRVRWWCVQIFDHQGDERAMRAIARCLDDPVPRVRRNAVHALTCEKCKPDGACALDDDTRARIAYIARHDPSPKVRAEAARGLAE